ncbi:hypothetical protein [Stenotrophomonas pavanii]|uniref:hypothetical protein n=2 Tax=Lysobacteraceae TaxID=32033 RepID=UPI0039C60DCC
MIERLPASMGAHEPDAGPRPVRPSAAGPARDFRESVDGSPLRPDPESTGDARPIASDIAASAEHGAGQAMLLAWQLLPNNGLSQMLAGTRAAAEAMQPSRIPLAGYHGSSVGCPGMAAANSVPAVAAMSGRSAATAVALAAPNARVTAASTAADAVGASAALSELGERWQARLLRWGRTAGEGLSIRIRDYRLDAQDAQALAERLLAFAGRHGLQLQRIVINARELWRATHTYPQPTGDMHGR